MKSSFAILLAAIVLAGCQNPYPEGVQFSREAPEVTPAPALPYAVDIEDVLLFSEGSASEYTIHARVPAPGRPVVRIFDLPEGAEFFEGESKLVWNPDYSAANNPDDLSTLGRAYPIRIVVQSTESTFGYFEKRVVLWVQDSPRPARIELESNLEFVEGEPSEHFFRVISEDFPEGPFGISTDGLPQGAQILPVSGSRNRFKLVYTPSYQEVTNAHASDARGYYRDLDVGVAFTEPRGTRVRQTVKCRIRDNRQAPKISAPSELNQAMDVTFLLSAEDTNGEGSPRFAIEQRPPFGQLRVETQSIPAGPAGMPVTRLIVRWYDIPPSHFGQTGDFQFRACSLANSDGRSTCSTHQIRVHLTGIVHSPPEIDRRDWPLGTVRRFRAGERLTLPFPIVDAETRLPVDRVEIELQPDSEDTVRWSDGVLTVSSQTPGIKQFNIRAFSDYGMARVESMVYEILPPEQTNE